jgi:hypothetical protein
MSRAVAGAAASGQAGAHGDVGMGLRRGEGLESRRAGGRRHHRPGFTFGRSYDTPCAAVEIGHASIGEAPPDAPPPWIADPAQIARKK